MVRRRAEKSRVIMAATLTNLLCRMEAAHRQTRAHLERIERQISARAEHMTTIAKTKAKAHPRGGSRWTRSDDAMFPPMSTSSASSGAVKSMSSAESYPAGARDPSREGEDHCR